MKGYVDKINKSKNLYYTILINNFLENFKYRFELKFKLILKFDQNI